MLVPQKSQVNFFHIRTLKLFPVGINMTNPYLQKLYPLLMAVYKMQNQKLHQNNDLYLTKKIKLFF
jgi:hypothetical protein